MPRGMGAAVKLVSAFAVSLPYKIVDISLPFKPLWRSLVCLSLSLFLYIYHRSKYFILTQNKLTIRFVDVLRMIIFIYNDDAREYQFKITVTHSFEHLMIKIKGFEIN